jgi:hypothetical protein
MNSLKANYKISTSKDTKKKHTHKQIKQDNVYHVYSKHLIGTVMRREEIYILRHTDPLLDNDREGNETTAIAMQQLHKYATVPEPLLDSGPRATMEVLLEAVFSMWSAPRPCRSTARVQFN